MEGYIKKFGLISTIAVVLLVFFALSFKKPYSEKTLIANLEPYPDTLYYSVPAMNFVKGDGFQMDIGGAELKPATPPLYSYYLIPFFAAFKDVRSFYFANMVLMFGSVIFVMLSVNSLLDKKNLTNLLLTGVVGFLFVTNFYVYTMATYLMAETISLFLVSLGLYLFTTRPSQVRDMLASQIGVLLLLVKFSNAPITIVFYGAYLLKMTLELKNKTRVPLFLGMSVAGVGYFLAYLFASKILIDHKNLNANSGMSLSHVAENLPWYIESFFGGDTRYLWFREKLISPLIAFIGFLGVIFGYLCRKHLSIIHLSLAAITATILFMSLFVAQDARYLIVLLPFIFILVTIFFLHVQKYFGEKTALSKILFIVGLILLVKQFGYNGQESSIISYKKQIGLNFKHAEVPWHFKAVQEFNSFTEHLNTNGKKIYIGTFLPPHFVDLYSNEMYTTLPIDPNQEFYWLDENIRQEVFNNNLLKKYDELIQEGHFVYVTHYYVNNNTENWKPHYETIERRYNLERAFEGCLGGCDLYKVTKKLN